MLCLLLRFKFGIHAAAMWNLPARKKEKVREEKKAHTKNNARYVLVNDWICLEWRNDAHIARPSVLNAMIFNAYMNNTRLLRMKVVFPIVISYKVMLIMVSLNWFWFTQSQSFWFSFTRSLSHHFSRANPPFLLLNWFVATISFLRPNK